MPGKACDLVVEPFAGSGKIDTGEKSLALLEKTLRTLQAVNTALWFSFIMCPLGLFRTRKIRTATRRACRLAENNRAPVERREGVAAGLLALRGGGRVLPGNVINMVSKFAKRTMKSKC
jgi:hypothetical protein